MKPSTWWFLGLMGLALGIAFWAGVLFERYAAVSERWANGGWEQLRRVESVPCVTQLSDFIVVLASDGVTRLGEDFRTVPLPDDAHYVMSVGGRVAVAGSGGVIRFVPTTSNAVLGCDVGGGVW